MSSLSQIEWHDLSLTELSIGEKGITLVVAPFDEASGEYGSVVLTLSDFGDLKVSMVSEIGLPTLAEMEVNGFRFQHSGSRLSGKISVLTGSTGSWSIEFNNAEWSLVASPNQ